MPYTMKKVKGGYQVAGPSGVHAKHTSKAKAEAQIRLLHGVESGWHPTGGNALRNAVMGSSQAVLRMAKARMKKKSRKGE